MTAFETKIGRLRAEGEFFVRGRPVYIGRSPGRLDLMDGNVDYTRGLVLEATIRQATWGGVQLRTARRIVFWYPQMPEHGWRGRVEFDFDAMTSEDAVRRMANA